MVAKAGGGVNGFMTIDEIKTLTQQDPSYQFLKTSPHLGRNILFLTLGGSYAYGTNVEGSDVDVRGVARNRPEELLGLASFEQVTDKATDTTVYGFSKFISLLINCNPNIVEMLGCRPEHYLVMTEAGQELLDKRHMFLSQRAVNAFGGYATQQLRRLESALARDHMPQRRREEHTVNSMNRAMSSFTSHYMPLPDDGVKLYIDKSSREGMETEIFADVRLTRYPVRDFKSVLNELANVVGTYDKIGARNKKDDAHLNKHAMHLIRLYLMCIDILEKGEIITYRGAEHEMLMDIRNGKYQNDDGTYQAEFFDMVSEYEKRMDYAKRNTSLPANPDMKKIEEFMIEINRRSVLELD